MVGTASDMAQRVGFAPITRIDAARREIEVTATSEAVDAYGTVFDYAASKDAFARWLGNVREMHESLAVGRRVGVDYDDAGRQVRVRLRISRGAESTWQKILDGTLCGASIGAANVAWEARRFADAEEPVRVATAYDLVELSLVDNPANPDCLGIALVRGKLPDADLLDEMEDESNTNATKIHERRENERDTQEGEEEEASELPLHAGMRVMALACGCALCGEIAEMLGSPQSSGQDESRPYAPSIEEGGEATTRAADTGWRHVVGTEQRLAAGLALLRGDLDRAAQEQHAALADLRVRMERIERQPQPGGPVLRAAEKVLGAPLGSNGLNVPERIAALQEFGATRSDQRAQVEVAAEILRLQRGEG